MNRLGCMLGALLAAVVLGVGLVAALPQETLGTSAADVDAAFRAELDIASAQGLSTHEVEEFDGSPVELVLLPAPNQCVAIVVAAIGPDLITEASLTLPSASASERARATDSSLVHLAICSGEGEHAVDVSIRVGTEHAHYGPTVLRYAAFFGPVPADPSSYSRLSMSPEMRREIEASAALARASSLLGAGRRIRAGVNIPAERAVLLPVDASTYGARRVLSGFGVRVPEIVSSTSHPIDPFRAPTDVVSPPTVFSRAGRLRLLLALDVGELRSECVALAFTRRDDPVTAIPITRIQLPSLEEVTLDASDPAVAIDVLCPAEGLFAYGVPTNDGGEYNLEVVAQAGPDGMHASPFTAHLAPVVLPIVTARRAACTAGAETACIDLASLARDGVHGAGTPAQALEPFCNAHGGRTCALMAGLESDPVGADRFERRACATGVLPSCLRHAATLRSAARLEDSLRIYRFACGSGEPTACAAVSTFAEWSIAPPVEIPSAERLP